MNIAILDYSASEVRLIKNCPDSWEEEQIEEYIYGEDGLDLSESRYDTRPRENAPLYVGKFVTGKIP